MLPSIVAILPARYAATRLPGKPLLDIGGKPMIMRVVERAQSCALIQRVIVATDDERIYQAVTAAGAEAQMTSSSHCTGTDRLAEVAAALDAEIIVNVQGDEPLIEPSVIEQAIAPLLEDESLQMATTCEPIEQAADVLNPNVVKVVTDHAGFALYFSRHPLPYPRNEVIQHGSLEAALQNEPALLQRYAKHTGLYVYRRAFLLRYAQLPATPLEQSESLEQLRALENGFRIKVVKVAHRSIGVDTPEDLAFVGKQFDKT
ncbi:MAG: 3-deoxy-manno-octulosonate cytidylyltransferase [Acidobacteria bacterium]|nr:3-deoxy-manno-octulosonate cytidylyltransferase [Acidobacteriota bacterium]